MHPSELSNESTPSETVTPPAERGSLEAVATDSNDGDTSEAQKEPASAKEESPAEKANKEEASPQEDAGEPLREVTPEPEAPETGSPPPTWGNFTRCQGRWVLTTEDPKHCGGCGIQCSNGQRCCGGICGAGSQEVCNGKDDDCDGAIDEETTQCVAVYAGLDLAEEGPAMWTPLSGPMGLTLDSSGNLYIAERNRFRVRKLSPDGILTTLAGSGSYSIDGITDGLKVVPSLANFQGPIILRLDASEKNLKVIQSVHNTVWNIHLDPVQANARVSGIALPSAVIDLVYLTPSTVYYSSFAGSTVYKYEWNTRKATRYAGGAGPNFDGKRLDIRFGLITGMEFNNKGELFLIDDRYFSIKKIDTSDTVATYAGRGFEGNLNGPRSQALFSDISTILFDGQGGMFVLDSGNSQVRKIDATGQVFIYAGDLEGYKDGKLRDARFFYPTGLAQDKQGNLYVADTGNLRIRKIDPQGVVSTIAGATRFRNGAWHETQLNEPKGLAFDSKGNLYVADAANHRIVVFDTKGNSRILLGSGGQRMLRIRSRFVQPGVQKRKSFHLYNPVDIAVSPSDTVAMTQQFDSKLLLVEPNGKEFFWGNSTSSAGYDGSYTVASFRSPEGLTYLKDGRLLIADTAAHRIRIINATNDKVSTLAGTGAAGKLDGEAKKATLNEPKGLLVDEARKRVYIVDTGNHLIRMYDFATDKVSLWAGTKEGYTDGSAQQAAFRSPIGLSWGPNQKDIYVADTGNHCIRKITLDAQGKADQVSTFLGDGLPGSRSGTTKQVRFRSPTHLRWGPDKKLYISDTGNHLLRIFTP
ncbi:MAG: hypothetical protein EP343_34420 [Deltaproteobacteria bacterium]|nr:MAG: hypothetical protein EP343_34420 [Deltaproteobacteria bacterium]